MPESAAKHRRWPKRAAWLLILAVLLLLVVLFWERAATEVCLRLACSPRRRFREFGSQCLLRLGPRAVPYLIPWVMSPKLPHCHEARTFVGKQWSSLTAEQLAFIAPRILQGDFTVRRHFLPGWPLGYRVKFELWCHLRGTFDLVERVEVLEQEDVVASCEISRPQAGVGWRAEQEWQTVSGAPPRSLALVSGADEVTKALQELGEHEVRFSLELVDSRLPERLRIERTAVTITTTDTLPEGYFFPLDTSVVEAALGMPLTVEAKQVHGDRYLRFRVAGGGPHFRVPYPCAAHIQVRETGDEFALGWEELVWLNVGYPNRPVGEAALSELRLQPSGTYHLRVVLKPDPKPAWLDPRVREYRAGELESNWVEVTVPEREEQ